MKFIKKRKIKLQRNNKRKVIFFYSLITAVSLFSVLGMAVLLAIKAQQPLFISPLPTVKAMAAHFVEDPQVKTIEKELKAKSISYTTVESKDSLYIVKLENGADVTLSAKKDIIVQISSLQFILSRLTMEGRQFSSLDLQFDKPIVVFKE